MSASPFAQPAPPGSGIKWEELNGALLVVEPTSVETGIQTAYGVSDAVKANVYVLDGDLAGEEFPSALVFPKLLQSQFGSQIGQQILGRLGQGQGKPGQSPPWLLQPATDDDQQTAARWLEHRNKTAFQQPTQDATPPAQEAKQVPW